MNAATIIIGLIILIIFLLALKNVIKNIITGKGNCSCGCDSCPGNTNCHSGRRTDSP